jgi:phosphatidate phosphatase APP1
MKNRVRKSLHFLEEGFDKINAAFRNSHGYTGDVIIVPYRGYGNKEKIYFSGRVLKDRKITKTAPEDGILNNILRMYKHFGSQELAGISITATWGHINESTHTDDEGYFHFELPFLGKTDENQLWHKFELKLTDELRFKVSQTIWVQVPVHETTFGVISDIDDTILKTGAGNLLTAISNTFTKNADTRLSFPGVQQLYAGLQKGASPHAVNPMFYLSNSPWNLYDFLDEFIELKNIPRGSILLRDFGLDHKKMIFDDDHKLHTIEKLLCTFPELPFILIGDSGEKDPEYYRQVVKEFPNRIAAIYIRDVSNEKRDKELTEIVAEVEALGVPMFLMQDSYTAAAHAETMGWIDQEALELVQKAVQQ